MKKRRMKNEGMLSLVMWKRMGAFHGRTLAHSFNRTAATINSHTYVNVRRHVCAETVRVRK